MSFLIIILFLSGCSLYNPYKQEKYALEAINSWFSYDDLGKVRRNLEEISEITNTSCTYLENDKYFHYVFSCDISYKPIGETIIPLAVDEKISVYVVLTYIDKKDYEYIVYHSKSKDHIWLDDATLNYGNKK